MYTIHSQTIALLPVPNPGREQGELHTLIFEINRSFIVPYPPTQIVKRHVRKYAGSYMAQQERAMKMLQETKMVPIACPTASGFEIALTPTHAATNPKVIWFAPIHILRFDHRNQCIYTRYGTHFLFPVAEETYNRQFVKGITLQRMLSNRKQFLLHYKSSKKQHTS